MPQASQPDAGQRPERPGAAAEQPQQQRRQRHTEACQAVSASPAGSKRDRPSSRAPASGPGSPSPNSGSGELRGAAAGRQAWPPKRRRTAAALPAPLPQWQPKAHQATTPARAEPQAAGYTVATGAAAAQRPAAEAAVQLRDGRATAAATGAGEDAARKTPLAAGRPGGAAKQARSGRPASGVAKRTAAATGTRRATAERKHAAAAAKRAGRARQIAAAAATAAGPQHDASPAMQTRWGGSRTIVADAARKPALPAAAASPPPSPAPPPAVKLPHTPSPVARSPVSVRAPQQRQAPAAAVRLAAAPPAAAAATAAAAGAMRLAQQPFEQRSAQQKRGGGANAAEVLAHVNQLVVGAMLDSQRISAEARRQWGHSVLDQFARRL